MRLRIRHSQLAWWKSVHSATEEELVQDIAILSEAVERLNITLTVRQFCLRNGDAIPPEVAGLKYKTYFRMDQKLDKKRAKLAKLRIHKPAGAVDVSTLTRSRDS